MQALCSCPAIMPGFQSRGAPTRRQSACSHARSTQLTASLLPDTPSKASTYAYCASSEGVRRRGSTPMRRSKSLGSVAVG